jgi:peptidoglycan/LPS O-acetylase OafA/YrhL
VPVVLYHAGLTWLSGGFVGVDVFFVISGYLITSIILSDLDRGSFSILQFYRRRVLRILPLLVVVVLAVLAVGYCILFPFELRPLGETVTAAALFVSNFYFWITTDYFDSPANSVPLLHTWSLAVEEQFYIFFPLVLLALHRWARRYLVFALIAAVIASLVLSVFGTSIARIATFYLLPTRAWELGAGAILAAAGAPAIAFRPAREAIAALALALVVAPMFYLSEASTFPGLNAVPPVLGATLLIAYGEGTLVGRVLQWRPLVYIGLISYALYLWHWPVIVFDTFITGPDMGPLDIARVTALSLLLAALSRPLIETPFRHGLRVKSSVWVVVTGGVALVVIAGLGYLFTRPDMPPRQYPTKVMAMADYAQYTHTAEYRDDFRAGTCFVDDSFPAGTMVDRDTCLKLAPDKPNILLLGDSHAAHLSGGLRAAYPQYHFLQATMAGCRPIPGSVQYPTCTTLMNYVLDDLIPAGGLDGIILAGRWGHADVPGLLDLTRQIRPFTGKLMVLGPTVEYGGAVPTILARKQIWGGDAQTLSRAAMPNPARVDAELATTLDGKDLTYRSIIGIICPDRHCREMIDGVPLQFDYGHLTLPGSVFVATGLLDGWLTP